ncbi:MAG: phosphatase PAP2 family protein [Bacteroidia bacterium]|nr:phosphatase PAP2 family protein [Bacteroidia bacterium]
MARVSIVVLLCTLTIASNAQNDSNYIHFNKRYFKSLLLDTKDVFLFPKYLDKKDALIATGATLLATATFAVDRNWALLLQSNQHPDLHNISKYGLEPFGSGYYSVPVLVVFYAHGALAHNSHSNRIAMLGIKAFMISGALAQIPKFVAQRERPQSTINENYNPFLFHPFSHKQKHHSFYSGHTTTAFAVAGIIAQEYKHKWWVGAVSYTVASGVALSRNYDNKHWLSDVAFGALTGYGISRLIYMRQNHKRK